jgi:hypothetical protein
MCRRTKKNRTPEDKSQCEFCVCIPEFCNEREKTLAKTHNCPQFIPDISVFFTYKRDEE